MASALSEKIDVSAVEDSANADFMPVSVNAVFSTVSDRAEADLALSSISDSADANIILKYLREFLTEFKNNLGCES
jgi:hypothetical protein